MLVADAMTTLTLELGPGHTLRRAAECMTERRVGAAVVSDPDGAGPGIITERDILRALGSGLDVDAELVGEHASTDVVYAAPEWSLDDAAAAMVEGGFRHLVVMRGSELAGIISVRDISRAWAQERGVLERRRGGVAAEEHDEAVVGTA
ncbi:CBS domain-containing protein [Patulibacter sp. SYSU D01012]|uniref:CBS domain-containing protein n=1 Tax=Patulibacter sp. SYSU D01012 TaxID=2817381 RepID=UPI001B316DC8|nr:CBS domain-containing protein [Patulibacter sp. SYSU D01012]